MKTVSIGFIREDGDLQLLATLNNTDEHLDQRQFEHLVANTVDFYRVKVSPDIKAYERDDAPDYICMEQQ